jgi:TetR/AcrR family transcriptional repressor of nem operon
MARPFEFDRETALNNAMLLFWSQGYFNTSFQDIVVELELSRSSIYNSFTDKRSLFIESLKHYIDKESKSLIETLSKLPPNQTSLKKILEQVVFKNLTETPSGCLVVNSVIEFANHDKEIKQIIEGNVIQVISAFSDFMKAGQSLGNFNTGVKPEALASLLFHQLTALRVTSKVIADKSFFQNTINTFIQLLTKF